MSKLGVLMLVTAALLPIRPVSAQGLPEDGTVTQRQTVALYRLELRDGSVLFGDVVRQDETEVIFRTQGGTTLVALRSDVLSLTIVEGLVADGEFRQADPNVTRLFFGPTGRSLKRGQVYLGVYEIILPFVQVGVTDRISIGGGTPLMFGEGESDRPFWLTPKVQVLRGDKTQVSIGAFHGFSGEGDSGGIGYVVATRGSAASSFTIGTGLAYSTGGGREGVLMLGGETQFRRNMKFVTENYFWRGGHAVVSGGVRFFGDRLSADLALVSPITEGFFFGPLVNFVYIF